MSAERQIASLLRIAAEDLRGAQILAQGGNRNAVYLCSQAAEKVIRAMLTAEGIHGGVRHLLREMVGLLPPENPLKAEFRAVEHLGAFATTFRYPTAGGRVPPTPDQAVLERDMEGTERLLASCVAHFGVDLAGTGAARTAVPPR